MEPAKENAVVKKNSVTSVKQNEHYVRDGHQNDYYKLKDFSTFKYFVDAWMFIQDNSSRYGLPMVSWGDRVKFSMVPPILTHNFLINLCYFQGGFLMEHSVSYITIMALQYIILGDERIRFIGEASLVGLDIKNEQKYAKNVQTFMKHQQLFDTRLEGAAIALIHPDGTIDIVTARAIHKIDMPILTFQVRVELTRAIYKDVSKLKYRQCLNVGNDKDVKKMVGDKSHTLEVLSDPFLIPGNVLTYQHGKLISRNTVSFNELRRDRMFSGLCNINFFRSMNADEVKWFICKLKGKEIIQIGPIDFARLMEVSFALADDVEAVASMNN